MAGVEGRFSGENKLDSGEVQRDEVRNLEPDRSFNSEEVMSRLFADDFAAAVDPSEKNEDGTKERPEDRSDDLNEGHAPDGKLEDNKNICETDDNGKVFKTNGELEPDMKYMIDGILYRTDGQGRIISCDGNARQTPDGKRDADAQKQAGGEDRKEGDQGGHILSRILGGAKGIENLIAIRGTINNGPYKAMEKEINQALSEGKDAHIHVEIKYEGDSKRPSKIVVIHTIEGKETKTEYDNDEGSTDLLDSVEDKVDKEQYNDLEQEISDANEDGGNISIIAVKTEYDSNGDITRVTVTMRDESSNGPNEKRVLVPKEDGE